MASFRASTALFSASVTPSPMPSAASAMPLSSASWASVTSFLALYSLPAALSNSLPAFSRMVSVRAAIFSSSSTTCISRSMVPMISTLATPVMPVSLPVSSLSTKSLSGPTSMSLLLMAATITGIMEGFTFRI